MPSWPFAPPLLVGGLALEDLLLTVLVQLLLIIGAARAGAWVFGRLGQPQVVGEIAAGLLLGPSCLGRLAPDLFTSVFSPRTNEIFSVLGQLGLVFLMFLVGLEFEFGHLRELGRAAAAVAVAGIAAPFALGIVLGGWMHPHVAAHIPRLGFVLFLATALSITSIPILGRILVELDLTRTRLGVLTISAAAVDDALGWIALATVSAIVIGNFEPLAVLRMLGLTLALALVAVAVARPVLRAWVARVVPSRDAAFGLGPLSLLMLIVIAAAILTNWIGIFSIFGPFLLGAVLWDEHAFRDVVGARLRDFVNAFFLPIFFTYTGLHTDVRLIDTPLLWLICAAVLAAAVVGKVAGCGLAARLAGLGWRESGAVAVMMNTRALMGLVAINVGRDLGVIPDSVFGMLVIMALATTFPTAPLLRRLLHIVRPVSPEAEPARW